VTPQTGSRGISRRGLAVRGAISDADLDLELRRIAADRVELARRLAALVPAPEPEAVVSRDLLDELRTRLAAGFSPEQQHEIVRLLVARIVVHTELYEDGTKSVSAVIEYRFPSVGPTCTGTGAGQDYTHLRRIIELPVGRWSRATRPLVASTSTEGAAA